MKKITNLTTEAEILKEFAARLVRIRKAIGLNQVELANKAGLGIATLRRIESGQDSHFGSWLKLLKALDMIHAIEELLPNTFNSPMEEVLGKKLQKRRKSSPSNRIKWGDEIK